MAVSISFNGLVYSIPETGDESWGESLTSYFVAIPQGALQKTGGAFTLTAEVNFGPTYGLLSSYFKTRSSNPSTAGLLRLAVGDSIGWRNNANGGNLLLGVNSSDQLTFNGTAIYPAGITALTGDVTAAGPGVAVATITPLVIVNSMISNSAAIAYSKLNLAGSIVNVDINASAAIDFSKLAALASGNILVGNGSNVAVSVAVTGDVTISNAGVTAIGNNKVTLGMLAQIATQTFLGRTSGSTGNVENLTATQATAILNAFVGDSGSGGTKGLVPAPSSGDAAANKVLGAGGSWVLPGTASPLTTKGDIYTYTNINARHGVPNNYGSLIADSQQTDGWRNATYTMTAGRPGKNYIQYADFENNATTGWSLGTATLTSSLPTGAPTFGSGASGNLTLSATSSGPLAGTYSLSLASSAATTAGNFLASDAITIDTEDQAKVLSFKFFYSATSNPTNGNWSGTSSNSFGVAIYDVTNSAWIIPAGVFNLVQNSGVGICQGTWQTPSNMTQFRIVVYNANATAGAITVLFDDFYVGPQAMAFGPAVSDWVVYGTGPNSSFVGFGTTTNNLFSRRVGDSLQVEGTITVGTVTGATAQIPLAFNGGLITADGTKAPSGFNLGVTPLSGSSSSNSLYGFISAGAQQYINMSIQGTSNSGSTAAAGTTLTGNGATLNVRFMVPISGWSSNTVLSNDSDTRVVSAKLAKSGTQVIGSGGNTKITSWSVVYDDHGAWDNSNNRYVFPVSGRYRFTFVANINTARVAGAAYRINGVATDYYIGNDASGNRFGGTSEVNVNAGDYIEAWPYIDNTTTIQAGENNTFMSIERLSGPAVVAASESVNMRYTSTSTGATTLGAFTDFAYATKSYDSHNAYNTSTGVYAVPISGKYHISAALAMDSTLTTSQQFAIQAINSTSGVSVVGMKWVGNSTFPQAISQISTTISCNAGDQLKIQYFGTTGITSPAFLGSANLQWVCIERVGN